MADDSEEINSSFGFELKKDKKTGKTSYASTGSLVGSNDDMGWVMEQQIDTNPHPPINKEHIQTSIRASKKGIRPKKVKLKRITEINHQSIDF